jgi:hypothetical protein
MRWPLPRFFAGLSRAVVLLALVGGSALQAQHPAIQQIIDDVNADSLVWRMERLTGQVPVDVGQGDELILSRHKI